jgi:hypothetical protein
MVVPWRAFQCMVIARAARVRLPSAISLTSFLVYVHVCSCAVPEVRLVPDDSGLDATFDVAVDAGTDDGPGDDGSVGIESSGDDGGEGGECGAPTCCGSIPCFGADCPNQCDACASKCGGAQQECCVKQTLTCHSIGSLCP